MSAVPWRRTRAGRVAVIFAAFAAWAVAMVVAGVAPAHALESPAGKVVLTLTGKVGAPNTPEGVGFDMALLETLPQHSFSTKTPWYAQPRRFTGVLLRDLLHAAGAQRGTLHATALNDYRVTIPPEDVEGSGVMVAWLMDGKPMTVREKGPLVVIYPFDDRPELKSAVHYSRAIWQLRSLEIR